MHAAARGHEVSTEDKDVYIDWGHSEWFEPPSIALGECAAGFALDNLYRDLADDALITLDRAIYLRKAVQPPSRKRSDALAYASRRLLLRVAVATDDATRRRQN